MSRVNVVKSVLALLCLLRGVTGVEADGLAPDEPIRLADFPYCKPTPATLGHPYPQFRLPPEDFNQTTNRKTGITRVETPTTCLPEPQLSPFELPPGTNLLPTVYTNMFDGKQIEMPNTLPSTPNIPYNLHDGAPIVTRIERASPTDDLHDLLFELDGLLSKGSARQKLVRERLRRGIDILEGNPVRGRAYSGFPLLHYKGPEKIKRVDPRTRTVKVHQIWYDEHIESDTAFIDPTNVLEEPWFIEYTIDILSRGEDDFSPFVMYTDDPGVTDPDWQQHPPGRGRLAHIGMDQTFFPMQEGTRTVLRVKMTPGKYLKLSYTWGWRMHPPRIQVMENALRSFPGTAAPTADDPKPQPPSLFDTANQPVEQRTLPEWERLVFGDAPSATPASRAAAIAKIGDLSPAKRMWSALRAALERMDEPGWAEPVHEHVIAARAAYFDWRTRSRLPSGVEVYPHTDMTLLYVNNTIYGEFANDIALRIPEVRWPDWQKRGDKLWTVTLRNGDYFRHAYVNVDFGGARGWENQFKSSVRVGGSGCWFSFGRAHWMEVSKPIVLAAAQGITTVNHKVEILFNYEPSTRLRFYQFDQMHHDVGIYSIH